MTRPTIGSLCTGYGGLDMAAAAFYQALPIWHADPAPTASAILDHHWPAIPNLGDLTHIDWANTPRPTIITAGYPCQPFSVNGRRQGTNDDRHLWPHIADAIRILGPDRVVLENVAGHRSLGFGTVLGDLASLGFRVRWASVRASDVGAPHRRERVFIVADRATAPDPCGAASEQHPRESPEQKTGSAGRDQPRDRHAEQPVADGRPTAPDTGSEELARWTRLCTRGPAELGRRRPRDEPCPVDWGPYGPAVARWEQVAGPAPRPTQPSPLTGSPLLAPRFVEWMMGLEPGHVTDVTIPVDDGDQLSMFVDELIVPPTELRREAQLHALGNGVCPQQAYHGLATASAIPV